MKKLLTSIVSVALVLLMGFAVGCGNAVNKAGLRIRLISGASQQNGAYTYECKEGEDSREFKLSADTGLGDDEKFSWTLGTTPIGTGARITYKIGKSDEAQTITLTYKYDDGEEMWFEAKKDGKYQKASGADKTSTATIKVWVKAYVAPNAGENTGE
ncbi:MAG: hypothetical protein IJ542_01150 [Clostridia bacterium]|nr:hypothetical protein [Clostridia bacterium]